MSKLEIYKDKTKQSRWRAIATNGRILADCGEGYKRKCDCLRGMRAVIKLLMPVVVEPKE